MNNVIVLLYYNLLHGQFVLLYYKFAYSEANLFIYFIPTNLSTINCDAEDFRHFTILYIIYRLIL